MKRTRTSAGGLRKLTFAAAVVGSLALATVLAQPRREMPTPSDEPTLYYEEYEPRSSLVVPENPVVRAKYPFVDVHAHLYRAYEMTPEEVDERIADMESLNMAVAVNLSGWSGERLEQSVANLKGRHPSRFAVFANISFEGIDDPDWGRRTAEGLAADVAAGAQGLKIYKNLGMFTKDASGKRVPTDDPRIDPVWAKAGELGIPVLIHTGEPSPFFEPHDRLNERWLELKLFPNRRRPPEEFATFDQTIGEQHNVFRKHPDTVFINAHLGWLGNDLARLGRLLDELPNVYTEVGAVLAELGRQPRFARRFLIEHPDRVLFGKDSWEPDEYRVYFRAFETADEYFDYYRRRHAFWKIYGLDLPDDVLRKVYYGNALEVVPGLDRSLFPPL